MEVQKSHKILIVEDEPSVRQALGDALGKLDYQIVTAVNGVEAIKKFKSEKPDLVLLDVVLPEKNGFDVLEEFRVNLKSSVPVIMLTNLESQQDMETAKNLNVTQYVLKSNISLRNLGIIVNKLLLPA